MSTLEPGYPVPDLRVIPGRFVPHRYAGASGDFNPIHIDRDSARAAGQPQNILHGLYMMTLVARAVGELGDGDPRRLRRLTVEFKAPGFPEREIAIGGSVTEVEQGTAKVEAKAEQGGTTLVTAEAEVTASRGGD
jgi:acyl dehydratase